MSSRQNSSQPEMPAAEALTVPAGIAAIFTAHGIQPSPPRRDDEFTAEQYSAYKGISSGAASNELLRMVRDGTVERRMLCRKFVYRFLDGKRR